MCYRCSASRHFIPSDRVVLNPHLHIAEDLHESLHRVCDSCIPALQHLATSVPDPGPSVGSVSSIIIPAPAEPSQNTGSNFSEADDRNLVECPVCRADLCQFGDEDLQAIHVATCLEGHSTSPTFNGGSRHLGMFPFFPQLSLILIHQFTGYRKEVH